MPNEQDSAREAKRSLTPPEVAVRYRVSADKVRGWIRRGELPAVNVASTLTGKPRFVVTAEGLAAFERKRCAAQPKQARRRRLAMGQVDYYPEVKGGLCE